MRRFFGGLLGLAVLMLGMLIPILTLAGLEGLIWAGRVFDGSQPKASPQYRFTMLVMPAAMIAGAYFTLYVFVLPIFAKFGVRIISKREKTNAFVGMARSVKESSLRRAALMDKLISQEKT
ncbi:MAG: hypothetical protein ACREFF_15415 [Candidatus Udaeobacter sp.]